MHKKLATDLTSLAHSILQMKNKEDVLALKQKAHEIYEKLAVLAYVDEYINTTPSAEQTKEEILEKIDNALIPKKEVDKKEVQKEVINETIEEEIIEEPILNVVEEILEQPFEELEKTLFSSEETKVEIKEVEHKKVMTLEDELEDTISVDVAADLFEKPSDKKSLNDTLQANIQIGLNDRIAFVKNLFEGNQGDFNRVVSQLNTLKTEKEAKKFISKMVKPDYNWNDKEEYEERFMSIIERKFA